MVGRKLQQYKIVEHINEGGMSNIYLGIHTQLERKVAIKSLNSLAITQSEIVKRFRNEAITLGSLKHPNIVTLYDYIERPNGVYLVLEYVEGETLSDYIEQNGPMDEEEAISMFVQILEAIHFAHQQGIIHRDLKPSNFMINKHKKVKILDFGIAKPERANVRITQTGMKVGTTMFMSPEQIKGKLVDRRSDIYSLGVTLYRMLTGEFPYDEDLSEFDISVKIVNDPFPDPRKLNPTVSSTLAKSIKKATQKKPYERYQSCKEFAEDISGTTLPFPFNLTAFLSQNQPEQIKSSFFNSKFWRSLILMLFAIIIAAGIAKWVFRGDTLLHVVQNDLNLKAEKKADADVIATLNYGETVRILDDEFWSPNRGVWLNVRSQYSEDGFVISNFLMDTKNFEITNSILANREARFQTDITEKHALLQLFKKNKWLKQNQALWRLKVGPEANIYNTIAKIDLNNDSTSDFSCVLHNRQLNHFALAILFKNSSPALVLEFDEPILIKKIKAGRKGGKWFLGNYQTKLKSTKQIPAYEYLPENGLLILKQNSKEKHVMRYFPHSNTYSMFLQP